MTKAPDIQLRFADQGTAPSLEIRCAPDAPVATSVWGILDVLGLKALSPYLVRKSGLLILHMKVARQGATLDQGTATSLLEALRSGHPLSDRDGRGAAAALSGGKAAATESASRASRMTVDSPSSRRHEPEVPHSRPWQRWEPQELQC